MHTEWTSVLKHDYSRPDRNSVVEVLDMGI